MWRLKIMNEETKQILRNQWAIMKSLFNQDEESDTELIKELDNTNDLLNPTEKPKTAKERMQEDTEEHFGEENKFGTRRE